MSSAASDRIEAHVSRIAFVVIIGSIMSILDTTIFYVNLPIGLIAFFASLRTLPRVERSQTDPLDVRGLLLMATGLPLFTYGLAEIGKTGSFTATSVLLPGFAGIALMAAFALHAL